ncbi:MAG TPA: tetratricopeptide repeat protein [Candidatus Kapabacteria bacterium]|jgi:tetratricopeptide (TPR) repeat protein|nr:tetratricopeptide repeat protein [Candidatus Kapabacteria bacterium]
MKSVLILFSLIFVIGISAPNIHAQATDSRVKAAMRFIDLGNDRQAVENLQALTKQDPKNAEAHAGLAIAYVDMNNIAAAAPEAQAGFDIDRRNILVRIARGQVFAKEGKVHDALDEFNQAMKLNDKEIGTYLALSRYYISIDSLKPAEITLYRAQQINDKDVRSYLGLAELYERQHIPDLAIGQYEQAMKLAPNDITVLARLASMYYRARRYNESANEWLKILHVDSTYADAYYQIGNLYFLGQQYPNAAAYAKRYVELKPNDIYGQWLLARALTESGQYQEAMPALQAVSSNDSLKALSQVLLARSYFYGKEYPKALEIYRSAAHLEPRDYTFYGVALFMTGDTTGAVEKLRQSLVNDTVRSAQEKQQVMSQIASWLYWQKRYSESADVFAQIAQVSPSVDSYLAAGQIYAAAKKTDVAEEYYQKALALDPNSVKARFQMALDYMNNTASDSAMAAFQKLEEVAKAKGNTDTAAIAEGLIGYHYFALKEWQKTLDEDGPAIRALETGKSPFLLNFELLEAQAYVQMQDIDKAEEYTNKALKLDPENKSAKEILEYIRKVKEQPKKKKP